MILMVCLDDNNGMMFNHRRQSRDRVLRAKVLELTQGSRLWMNAYSARQFARDEAPQICVEEAYLQAAQPGEFCFVEDQPVQQAAAQVEKVLVFRWNRVYPADQWFDLPLGEAPWQPIAVEEFAGSSHEKITMEVYIP